MPVVSVGRDKLFALLGRTMTEEEFDHLCFEFGIELDDVTSEKEQQIKERGVAEEGASEEVIYRIDVPANRYDLLCAEGLVTALKVFKGEIEPPVFSVVVPEGEAMTKMYVEPETAQIRPYVVAAILRGVTFTEDSKASFIELQDKLHHNICRKRTLVAIGTHDLDTVQGPFRYRAIAPEDISFVPLNKTEETTGAGVMDLYADDAHLKGFLPIIRDSPVYPVIYDAQDRVLSLPPIINSNHSKIELSTRNVLIECTATDHTKAMIVLNTIVAMFSQYCDEPFTAEAVQVVYPEGDARNERALAHYPDMSARTASADVAYINRVIGINEDAQGIAALLNKMMLPTAVGEDGASVDVSVPPTRSDVLHACDIAEDAAIAYGYNNLQKTEPKTYTVGKQLPINKLTDLLRLEVAMFEFTEILTFSLCSHADAFENLRREDDGQTAVLIGNPKTSDYEMARPTLMGGMLKTLAANASQPLPRKLFEITDVVIKDPSTDVGARNDRRLAVAYSNHSAEFEIVHGVLDRVMEVIGVAWADEPAKASASDGPAEAAAVSAATASLSYKLEEADDAAFFPGFQASIHLNNEVIGSVGIVHPEVLANFGISYPVSYLEMSIEPFLVDHSK
ncbi:phenylalanyl-tRNA synthetase, beta subunit [Thecamonas trahens ATCC 50062]|uniref:phenylalanine--tRNA ligase n=1 Tax=Thecamonas trahens ATCC 50062 TaxID=461836 RepID=A0A0L0DJN4_THETB|nr:phenylalanyl-tRNA synthetase, beta subunit [Thecamonas trahens ATCC 50062]KNC52321.1 phenylalanyl-tRNA synthetase, beta subunit [Thecamonas trahens ATCC 50062]|eukprot:XP_013762317.1 phenylalanyl-tRNA synthetase, beta subunit [Thecamonas trahens ATCC 50062]